MFLDKIKSSASIEKFAFEEEIYHRHCYLFNLRHIVKETGRSSTDKFDHQNISNNITFRSTALFNPTDICLSSSFYFILFLSQNNNFIF